MGFVEALISIMVVGVSSVILMQITASILKDMVKNETIDTMTQYAVEGATMVQNVAMQEKYSTNNVFPDEAGCYVIDKVDNQYSFRRNQTEYVRYILAQDRNTYKNDAAVEEDNLFFRIFCIENTALDDQYVVVKIIVGQSNTNDGEFTIGNNVQDYTYFTVANI